MSSIDNDTETGFSWRRVAGQSFALALHAGAFMFLIAPVMPPDAIEEEQDQVIDVTFIEPPPPPADQPPPSEEPQEEAEEAHHAEESL